MISGSLSKSKKLKKFNGKKLKSKKLNLMVSSYQNTWDATKALLRRKFMGLSTTLKNQRAQINTLMMHLKLVEKQKQAKCKNE
jgi:hypothetical protein